jgi:two-component system, OmpR family, sensor histidine kinase KdpD
MPRGTLRIYLGAAPGAGKTYAMLNEGQRRLARGTDAVALLVDAKGRPQTAAQLGDLELLRPCRAIDPNSSGDVDLRAAKRRHPEVALVDDYAHTNAPGSEHPKRWMDVEALLEDGIDVITTLNIQHLESLADVVASITGTEEPEAIPDAVVRQADQIELVDITPEALRRRMAHGNVFPPEHINGALSHYFRVENLGALRELALEWMADHADQRLAAYRATEGVSEPWDTRERVVVALTGAPGGEHLLRRGARMAARTKADLVAVHVRTDEEHRNAMAALETYRGLAEALGGQFTIISGQRVADSLVAFARAENATQLVMGASRQNRWSELVRGSVINSVLREAGSIDVHVVSSADDHSAGSENRGTNPGLPRRRLRLGWLLALVGIPVLTFGLVPLRGDTSLSTILLLLLLGTVCVAAVGGVKPGLVSALVAAALADWYFVPPIHHWRISHTDDVVILIAFVAIAGAFAILTDRLARRGSEVARVRAEAETLNRLASRSVMPTTEALSELVEEVRATFQLDGVALLTPNEAGWNIQASAGIAPPASPDQADLVAELADGSTLAVHGAHNLSGHERRLLNTFVAQFRLAQQQIVLQAEAASATALGEANRLRTALLAAVSHDLRTPLSSIKAAATSVLSKEVTWPPEAIRSFCETIDLEADRLNGLVGNLLDMSRLQAGVLSINLRSTAPEEVVFSAVKSLSRDTKNLAIAVPEALPPIATDPALLERAVANVIDNALSWSPTDSPVRVEADSVAGHVELRVVDRGPGIPPAQRVAVFQPFQRLGDGPSAQQHGVGLGLAVARGFVQSMGADFRIEDTPGGGVTALFTLPLA